MNINALMSQDKQFGEITVYALTEKTKTELLKMAESNTVDGKLVIEGPELLGKLLVLCTNIPDEFINDNDILIQILEQPSADLEDAIVEIQSMVQSYFNRFTKQVKELDNLPDEVLKQVVEAEVQKVREKDEDYQKYLELKNRYE